MSHSRAHSGPVGVQLLAAVAPAVEAHQHGRAARLIEDSKHPGNADGIVYAKP